MKFKKRKKNESHGLNTRKTKQNTKDLEDTIVTIQTKSQRGKNTMYQHFGAAARTVIRGYIYSFGVFFFSFKCLYFKKKSPNQ